MRELRVYVGPVHSEKTTRAMRAAGRYKRLKKKVVLLRPARSIREWEKPGTLTSKNGQSFPSIDLETAGEIAEAAKGADVVWFDEPMLFPDEAKVFDAIQRVREHSIVMVSGLSATSEVEPFGSSMPKLLAVADEIVHLRADCDVCGDFNTATRSICLKEKRGQVLVGGEETYQAVCPACWQKMTTRPKVPA